MNKTIWYISKYFASSANKKASVGTRGFFLMREFARLGCQSVIISSDANHLSVMPNFRKPYLFQKIDGVKIYWVRTIKYFKAKSFKRILSWIHFEWRLFLMPHSSLPSPDVIIISSPSLLTILNGFLLRKRYKCQLVFEVRDIWPLTLIEEGGYSKFNFFILAFSWLERLGYRYSDVVIGTMPNLSEYVSKIIGFQKKVGCIPIGVDLDADKNSRILSDKYSRTYLPLNKFVVAYAGTIGISNNLETLLQCAEKFKHNSKIHFLIAGDGDLKVSYQYKYKHLKNLTFAPKVPKQMVQNLLSKCDLLYFSVHDSKVWRYGQSLNKLIDYMYSGKPIVASYTGFQSMINEAGCGEFLPANDIIALKTEISRFADMSKKERDKIGKQGHDWLIKNRSYNILAKTYLDLIFSETPFFIFDHNK